MSVIFYAEDNEDIRELYSFIMEADLGHEVVEFENGTQLVNALKTSNHEVAPQFVVSDFDMPGGNGDVVFDYLKSLGFQTPLVFLTSQVIQQIPGLTDFFDQNSKNRLILKPATNEEVVKTLGELNGEEHCSEVAKAEGFKFISFKRIKKWDLTNHGLFIKLGDEKYLSIKAKGDPLEQEVIEKYQKKSVEGFFVSTDSFSELVNEKANKLNSILESQSVCRDLKLTAEVEAFQTVTESLTSLGVDEKILNLADNAIRSSIEGFADDEDIFRLFEKILHGNDFLSEHSLMTSYFCYFALDLLGQLETDKMSHFAMAAMMHDVGVKAKSAKVHDIHSISFQELRPDTKKRVLDHSEHGAELARTLPSSGELVYKLIMEHHESPDGNGFPKGLKAEEIAKESAIFIVCHELSAWLCQQGDFKKVDLKEFFDLERQRFSYPGFQETFHALESFLLD